MAESAPTAQNNVMDKLGIKVTGLVSEVSSYPDKTTGRLKYSVHLFIPGNALLKVGLDDGTNPAIYESKLSQPISMMLKSREFNGKVFFSEA
ncbi:MAG: hypothetical protein D3906_02510 [Candidatus Electrothrix sp. AUS1_2]|nr:hypothetical protein [Candidatus Electrothrix sp. AUS1_2]